VVSTMSAEDNDKRLLFLQDVEPMKLMDSWLDGSAANLPPLFANGGIRKIFDQQREIVEVLAARLEQIYEEFIAADPNFSPATLFNETRPGPLQPNWKASYEADGAFKGRYVTQTNCAFHKPSTEAMDSFHVDSDVMRLKDACDVMMQNFEKFKDSGLQFQVRTCSAICDTIDNITICMRIQLK
jgi:hypothetical protein